MSSSFTCAPPSPTPEQVALVLLMASVASAVITFAILAETWRRYLYSAAAGATAAIVFRLTPAGATVAAKADGVYQWIGLPIVGVLFALGLSAIVDAVLSSRLPVFGRLRAHGRRALRASRWGTAREIADRTGMEVGIVRLLGAGIQEPVVSLARILTRLRITANVLCGSCIGLFFVFPDFRDALWENLSWGHALINLIGTALVTFFIGPLHEEVLHLTAPPHASVAASDRPGPTGDRRLPWSRFAIFGLVAVLLFLLQAVHSAAHTALQTMTLYDWIILLELCALPLIVTTYYFGVALHHEGLGDARWDRAFGASIWFGAILLVPFTLVIVVKNALGPDLRARMVSAVMDPGSSGYPILFGLAVAFGAVLIAVALAAVASLATYGVYALALGFAMTGSTSATARRRGVLSILVAGAIVQAMVSGAVYWWVPDPGQFRYAPGVLGLGWAGGLLLSRFETELRVTDDHPSTTRR